MYDKSVKESFLRASIMNKGVSGREEDGAGAGAAVKSERVSVGGKAKTRGGEDGFGWEGEEGETSRVSLCHRWQRREERALIRYTFLIVSTICRSALSALPVTGFLLLYELGHCAVTLEDSAEKLGRNKAGDGWREES